MDDVRSDANVLKRTKIDVPVHCNDGESDIAIALPVMTYSRTDTASLWPLQRRWSVLKRVFDVFAVLMLLALLSPFLLLTAIAIKATSRGPVLFRQKRYGVGGEMFTIYKFRTMYSHQTDVSGVRQTSATDDRITPLGRILRRTNIDEIPQLLNVLCGDMSLVGPRPHVPGMLASGVRYEQLVSNYFERHAMRPGITGLAQVMGLRGSTTRARWAHERIEHDLAYIQHWTFGLDLKILWVTLQNEWRGGTGN